MNLEDGASKLAERSQRDESGCLVWTGGRDPDGYGIVRAGGRQHRAHRLAWTLARGPIPVGLVVMHSCDNPPCIDPAHLSLGTVAENNRDRERKGRSDDRNGEKSPTAVLTWPKVREIRRRAADGESHTAVAFIFGVSRSCVSLIVRGERWHDDAPTPTATRRTA